jgi:hypothetical protein
MKRERGFSRASVSSRTDRIQEVRQAAGSLRELPRVSSVLLVLLLAGSAPHREGCRPQALVGDVAPALETGPVLAHVEPAKSLVDTSQSLGSHLEQSEPHVSLGVYLGPFEIVVPIIRPAGARVADAALQVVLHLAPVFAEHLPQACISSRGVRHVCLPRPGSMQEEA